VQIATRKFKGDRCNQLMATPQMMGKSDEMFNLVRTAFASASTNNITLTAGAQAASGEDQHQNLQPHSQRTVQNSSNLSIHSVYQWKKCYCINKFDCAMHS
jgi:hypothetical protein